MQYILLNELGILALSSVPASNALSPTCLNPVPKYNSPPSSTLVHPLKALYPIVSTLLGIVNFSLNPVHPSKADSPIVLILSGITSSPVKLVQPLYLQPIITQYFASNKSEIWP